MSEDKKNLVKTQILSYLIAHPEAQDTLQGISQWWLLEQRITSATRDVEKALGSLVGEGWVIKIERHHTRDCYKVNDEKRAQITLLLESSGAINK